MDYYYITLKYKVEKCLKEFYESVYFWDWRRRYSISIIAFTYYKRLGYEVLLSSIVWERYVEDPLQKWGLRQTKT